MSEVTGEDIERAIAAAFPERWMIDSAIARGELGQKIADQLDRDEASAECSLSQSSMDSAA